MSAKQRQEGPFAVDAEAECAQLNERLGMPELRFELGAGGLVFARIECPLASAQVCLQGAQLTAWHPRSEAEPVIWLSSDARFAHGSAIRGGIPVCWPWFGPAAPAPGLPSHGLLRTRDWQPCGAAALADGGVELRLQRRDDASTRAAWPHAFLVELRLRIGSTLEVELASTLMADSATAADKDAAAATSAIATPDSSPRVGEALHTYFRVGDIAGVRIEGLDGRLFVDSVGGGVQRRQQGAVTFDREVDRVYADDGPECMIVDPLLGRRISITKSGSRSTVVWNPWSAKADRLADLGPGRNGQGGWREMVCVESGNALENTIVLVPGVTHRLGVHYRVESI
jgi:D-hexose-6-phosphate mutarotase